MYVIITLDCALLYLETMNTGLSVVIGDITHTSRKTKIL